MALGLKFAFPVQSGQFKMYVLGLCLFGFASLAAESLPDSSPQFIFWDARYYVVVRGTLTELNAIPQDSVAISVVEAPGSGVGVAEDPVQRNIRIKLGEPFEQKFGFFWGGTSRVGDPPRPLPKFLLKIEGYNHCLVQEVSAGQGGVSYVEIGDLELTELCNQPQGSPQ